MIGIRIELMLLVVPNFRYVNDYNSATRQNIGSSDIEKTTGRDSIYTEI